MLPHAVASAWWGERFPALQYEHTDPESERIIPRDIIQAIVLKERFAVVIWQGKRISFIDVEHIPERTFALDEDPGRSDVDWITIKYYVETNGGPTFTAMRQHLDPRDLILSIYTVLETPVGLAPGYGQDIVEPDQEIHRLLIEFPRFSEERDLSLDTDIGVLAGVSREEYMETVDYRRSEV